MFRPSFNPSAHQRAVGRNLALDLVAAVGVGVTVALVTTLLPTIARRGGLEPIGLAALAAAPFVANLLGAFAGRIGPRSQRQLALIRGAGAASLLVLAVLAAAPVMVAVSIVFWLSLSLSGPFHLRLWGSMYPARVRGRVVGFIGSGRAAAAAVAALAGGLLADQLGGQTAVALAGLVGLICALAYAGLRAPNAERPPTFSARDSVRALRERPVLANIAVAQGFYGGGLIAAVPLYAIVNVDRLDLSLADVGIIGILTAGATTFSFLVWGPSPTGAGRLWRCDSAVPSGWARSSPMPSRPTSPSCGSRRSPPEQAAPRSMSGSRPWSATIRRSRHERPRWPAGTRSRVLAGSSRRSP